MAKRRRPGSSLGVHRRHHSRLTCGDELLRTTANAPQSPGSVARLARSAAGPSPPRRARRRKLGRQLWRPEDPLSSKRAIGMTSGMTPGPPRRRSVSCGRSPRLSVAGQYASAAWCQPTVIVHGPVARTAMSACPFQRDGSAVRRGLLDQEVLAPTAEVRSTDRNRAGQPRPAPADQDRRRGAPGGREQRRTGPCAVLLLAVPHIEPPTTALGYFPLDGIDHATHREQPA
jgi:hypothetical protein